MAFTCFVLTERDRLILQKLFPPKYEKFIGHHITVEFGVPNDATAPSTDGDITVISHVDSEDGIEALVVTINGESQRPDGKTYHITWSLNPDAYKPVDSNKLIAFGEVRSVDFEPVVIEATGAVVF